MEVNSWKNLLFAAGFGEEAAKQYSDLFVKHEIDLSMLADLAHPVLESMGIWKAGHRIRILRMQRLIYSAQHGQGTPPRQCRLRNNLFLGLGRKISFGIRPYFLATGEF